MLKFYCINLKSRPDRLERFLKLNQNKINSSINVIEAINGKELNLNDYLDKINPLDYLVGKNQLPGVIGCCSSHFKVFQEIINNNLPYAIIMEDDLLLQDDLIKIQPLIMQATMMKVDLMYFNYPFPKESYQSDGNKNYHFKPFDGKLYTTEMYLVSNSFAKKVLDEFSNDIGAFDLVLKKTLMKFGGKVVVLDPPIADQFDRTDSNVR
jgi:GR25 family glycosyltransferase involved in LPS biosynthesis